VGEFGQIIIGDQQALADAIRVGQGRKDRMDAVTQRPQESLPKDCCFWFFPPITVDTPG
jgi:hypothetical protein